MTKLEILQLLKELIDYGSYAEYDKNDISGFNPHWKFSVENIKNRIDTEIDLENDRKRNINERSIET